VKVQPKEEVKKIEPKEVEKPVTTNQKTPKEIPTKTSSTTPTKKPEIASPSKVVKPRKGLFDSDSDDPF
jgi:hypothetical protein